MNSDLVQNCCIKKTQKNKNKTNKQKEIKQNAFPIRGEKVYC